MIVGDTGAKIRTFLYAVAEGTADYRSLHNLTEQVEHQYHGRFVIELIQNAHDALGNSGAPVEQRRISFTFSGEGQFGALYVANDGQPFSASNYKSISQLGQSDKDPQTSIGNKGIGFRSVLEITDSPSVYSRQDEGGSGFDGFCFEFSGQIREKILVPALELFGGNDHPKSPLGEGSIIEWDAALLQKFRDRVAASAAEKGISPEEWLTKEIEYLSPYLLPTPLGSSEKPNGVEKLEAEGYSSVLHFPLKDEAAAELVKQKLAEIDAGSLLFLDNIGILSIDIEGNVQTFRRTAQKMADHRHSGRSVVIHNEQTSAESQYLSWSNNLEMSEAPTVVQAALASLPGRWPELESARVTIAAQVGADPEEGQLSIFLPTHLKTGCAAHISAPFFADMSRTHIDFGPEGAEKPSKDAIFNRHLLTQAAELALSVVRHELAGKGEKEAQLIVDLLAPFSKDEAARQRWWNLLAKRVEAAGLDFVAEPWFLASDGWTGLNLTSILPKTTDHHVITEAQLRQHATFDVFPASMNSRVDLLKGLFSGFDIQSEPLPEALADSCEAIATSLLSDSETSWDGFWSDMSKLFNDDLSPLAGRKIVLGSDEQLHAGGTEGTVIFFAPRRGAAEADTAESDIRDIPESLRKYVAFVSDKLGTHKEENNRLGLTKLHRQLFTASLVREFRRETILTEVLLRNVPALPLPLNAPEVGICRDILSFGMRMIGTSRSASGALLKELQKLPVPCNGGWFQMDQASFGKDWHGTNGSLTHAYLSKCKAPDTDLLLERLLLSPTAPEWEGRGYDHLQILRDGQVFDGLDLIEIRPNGWKSAADSWGWRVGLPHRAPPWMDQEDWDVYRSFCEENRNAKYQSNTFQVQELNVIPGIARYRHLDVEARKAFMQVVLKSLSVWAEKYDFYKGVIAKRTGGYANEVILPSPTAFWLHTNLWLYITDGEVEAWSRPSERWHIPVAYLSNGRSWHYSHLFPLSIEIAHDVDHNPELAKALEFVGLNLFRPDNQDANNGLVLLDALRAALEGGRVPHRDVFLGQVRSAWHSFEPNDETVVPNGFLVQTTGSDLHVVQAEDDTVIYIPDSTKSATALRQFGLPVLAMEPATAKRLAPWLVEKFPNKMKRASTLEPRPSVDGQKWEGVAEGKFVDLPAFECVAPLVLTVIASYGPSAQGTATSAFQERVEELRTAGYRFGTRIETGLFDGDKLVSRTDTVQALWLPSEKVLLITPECQQQPALLSEALVAMLDRDDLELAFQMVLDKAGADPQPEDIVAGLEAIRLSDADYHAVREQWRGDLTLLAERLQVLALAINGGANVMGLTIAETEEVLIAAVSELLPVEMEPSAVVATARAAADWRSLATAIRGQFGLSLELAEWNRALLQIGLATVVNAGADSEFAGHMAQSEKIIRALLVHATRRDGTVGAFVDRIHDWKNLRCPSELKSAVWSIGFNLALSSGMPALAGWKLTADEQAALSSANDVAELSNLLEAAGVDTKFDPSQAELENVQLLRTTWQRFNTLGLIWALSTKTASPERWSDHAAALEHLQAQHDVHLRKWSFDDVWSLLKAIKPYPGHELFWQQLEQATDATDLQARLKISDAEIEEAGKKLSEHREAARRKNRLVDVCGGEFDNHEDALVELWSHINSKIPETAINAEFSLDRTNSLESLSGKKRDRNRSSASSGNRSPRQFQSKAMETLVGLTGEIHAFRALQSAYGKEVVSASNWISGSSAKVFPSNTCDDGAGYDITVSLPKKTYFIEVKSSSGEDESFKLGSSEIRFAMAQAAARQKAKRAKRAHNETYLIMRVLNALSDKPEFQMLPNPYDQQYQALFVMEEADARVRYRAI